MHVCVSCGMQAVLSDVCLRVRGLLSEGRLHQAHMLALTGAVAVQDDMAMYELSRTCCAAAQELSALLVGPVFELHSKHSCGFHTSVQQ